MAAVNQDTFFSQLFQTGMADPNSKVYLPGIILQTTNPSLNPYTMATLDLGPQNINGISINVLLNNLVIGGLPNVSVAPQNGGSFVLQGLNANMLTQFCTLSPPPPNVSSTLSFGSNFTLSFTGNQLKGTLNITINQAALNALMVISGTQLTNIIITMNSVNASVPTTATVTPTVTFEGGGGFWVALFQNFLKKPETIVTIVKEINQQLNTASILANLSNELTTLFQNAIKQQLDPQS